MKTVDIWTDGASSNNPGESGVGIIMQYQNTIKEINGYVPKATNNQMELLAAIISLDNLKQQANVNIFTDSKYLKDGLQTWLANWKNNNWKNASKQPVKNKKLWQKLDSLSQKHIINVHWVKGHSGIVNNERVDELCNLAIKNKAPLLTEYLEFLN